MAKMSNTFIYGTIERIRAFPAKGMNGNDLEKGLFIANSGLEGDYHADGGERQISLMIMESQKAITVSASNEVKGLCLSRYRENISISGLPSSILKPGLRLIAGEVILGITGEAKHCYPECELFEEGKACSYAGLNLFAKVICGGIINIGDRVALFEEE